MRIKAEMAQSALPRALKFFVLLAVGICLHAGAATLEIQRAYLGKHGTVHVVTADGRALRIGRKGRNSQIRVSKNKKVVGWISDSKDASSLKFYYEGKIRTIQGGPFVRDFWFVEDGRKIAADTGGMHFAGTEVLHDVATGRQLDEVDQWTVPYEKRPQWSTEYR